MKNDYFHKYIFLVLLFCFGYVLNTEAQEIDTILVGSNFKISSIKAFSLVNNKTINDGRSYFYFGFNKEYNTVNFTLKNNDDTPKDLVLEFSNALIKEIVLSTFKDEKIFLLHKTGIDYNISEKPIAHRLFAFPLHLNANETSTYQIRFKKEQGKPLVTSIVLKNNTLFRKQSLTQQTAIGLYYGISLLSVFFSLLAFSYLKKSTYLIYALYVVFLGLYISSYTGLFSQIFLDDANKINKYTHYVLFSEVTLLLFAVFSQKILETKTYTPKLKKLIDIFLIILIGLRVLIHFLFTDFFEQYVSVFMNLWYIVFLTVIAIIAAQIVLYFKTNFKRSSLFAIAYIFMISGVFITILYHGYGTINTTFYGLPVIFYSSFLEILFLTFTVVFMVKSIYDERNILSKKIVLEEKKNLTAFIKGEDQERKRISKELHDNIGSKLGYLRRVVSDKYRDETVNKVIDSVCDDVRNLSHQISPSDLKLIGFVNAVKDFANNLSNATTLKVGFNNYNFPEELDENTEIQLYRVMQESFNNILKHANAKHIDVQLFGHDNYATITIEDDGAGFETDNKKEGIGLKNMRSRIHQIRGQLEIDSKPNKGTSILITIPL